MAVGLIVGGLFLMFAEYRVKNKQEQLVQTVDGISLRQAFYIGFFQFLSLWPGFSRSGSTIGGAMMVGVGRKAGADFTFIMALPIMVCACLYELLKNLHSLSSGDLQVLALGFVVAFVVAYFSIVWFMKFLNKYTLSSFGVYRIVLAIFTLWFFYR